MQHFVNFGYVKQANNQLKRLNELKLGTGIAGIKTSSGERVKSLGNIAKNQVESPHKSNEIIQTALDSKIGSIRSYKQRSINKIDPLTKPIRESYREEPLPVTLPEQDWSDIRKTSDKAASSTGYLGFRKDPYKGYGGMMEESIPNAELYPNNTPQTAKKYVSRQTGWQVGW